MALSSRRPSPVWMALASGVGPSAAISGHRSVSPAARRHGAFVCSSADRDGSCARSPAARACTASPRKPSKAAEGAQHRLLHDIVRLRAAAGQPARKIIGRVQVRHRQRLEAAALLIHDRGRSNSPDGPLRDAIPGARCILFPPSRIIFGGGVGEAVEQIMLSIGPGEASG